ncbi:MAG TPA: undecaprenyldiphospho-muramoylpentapeptide beta-N-acetylglucosaminyltransferase [Polyangiaceae bacterium]|nr:undecaprenyldiphospho-muramoylpentapeptide beta-N-acetylglucosaminyltransferase [Polyangiaceae bacterium]
MSRPCVLFAGGGTGGHVFPAVAVAEAMQSMADVDVAFCGTARGVEARVVPARGWRLELLDVLPITGGGPVRAVRGAFVAARATASALLLVRRLRPAVVLSVGGYASGPVTLAAALQGVPVAVLEPNRVVGLANRLLAPFARRAYVAWEEAGAPFRAGARRVYGVPLRAGFAPKPYAPRGGIARVLVVGGSQGAEALNERVPPAMARLAHVAGLEVVHQAGRDRDAAVRVAYAKEGVARATVTPFLDDVARAVADADVVVARAGASTLGELTAVGRAAILVPYPHAAADHQGQNAEALARAGGAVCIRQDDATPERLAHELEKLLRDDAARVRMADASRARGRPGAATDVASDLLDLAGIARRPRPSSTNGTTRGQRSAAQEAH